MREIKFRAWNIETKCFFIWDLKFAFGGTGAIWGEVQQYTGLTDKNGKEIYEGDILKTEEFDEAGIDCGYIFQVEWFQDDINCGWNIARSDCWSAEVIGNIYENSELLK